MSRYMTIFALAAVVALGVLTLGAKKPTPTAGSWMVDTRHSDAQLITDGTTDNGKTKIDITVGFARVMGGLKLDDGDAAKSSLDLHIYPATSMVEPIEEDGQFKSRWMANRANHTMLCFHSKNIARTADGRLQASGDLVVVRVDRNVEIPAANEAYNGPVYGPPIVNRLTHQATLVFDPPEANAKSDGGLQTTASTKVFREDFPQLVRAVLNTYWPPVVQDESCSSPDVGSAYSGAKCTGTFLAPPSLPNDRGTHIGEDYPGAQEVNSQVGNRLNIVVHMRLRPGADHQMAGY